MTAPHRVKLAVLAAAGSLYVPACFLPGEPSGPSRVTFVLGFEQPYRVPLAGSIQPPIQILADGRVLQGANYRLESLDPGLVTVGGAGRGLQGVGRGSAAVRVAYQTANGARDTVFAVQVVVSRVAVDSPSLGFTRLGARARLRATAYDASDVAVPNVEFTWSSADPRVATVNDTGLVTAVDEGTVAITAEADSVKGLASITVMQVAAQVRLVPELDSLRTVGRTVQFFAVALDSGGRVLPGARPRWTSSAPLVATVDGAGRATATGAGTARIIARVGAAADTATLVVAQVIRFLLVTPGFDTLTAIADTARLGAVAFDSLNFSIPNPTVAWSTSDAAVATVDQGGLVRAAKNGVVLITASAAGQFASATVLVRQEVVGARIAEDNVTLTGAGAMVRLSGSALDRNGFVVDGAVLTWRSGSECVASVDGAGLITALGGGETRITASPASGGQSDTARVSVTGAPPAGAGDIAFESPRGIEVMCVDGGGRRVLIANESGAAVGWPAWSPDGASIAFSRSSPWPNPEGGGNRCLSAIYVARADGSNERRVTDYPQECDAAPSWSPDGTRIAFQRGLLTCDACQFPQVYQTYVAVVNAAGSDPGYVTEEGSVTAGGGIHASRPAWSPDGTKLAFEASQGSWYCDETFCYDWELFFSSIYAVNLNGTGRLDLTAGQRLGNYSYPAWSPDGSQIAVWRLDFRQSAIWLLNLDGSDARLLTTLGASPAFPAYAFPEYVSPAWSPDGSRVVFVLSDGSQHDLYLINRDGTDLRRLTSTPEYEYNPTWRPVVPLGGSRAATGAPLGPKQ